MEKNPFLNEEENEEKENEEVDGQYVIHEPSRREQLTEAQKKRNFKGLELMKKTLKKIGIHIKDYKEVS